MFGAYHFTPYLLPMLASAAIMAALAVYGLRHRTVTGALAFTGLLLSLFSAP